MRVALDGLLGTVLTKLGATTGLVKLPIAVADLHDWYSSLKSAKQRFNPNDIVDIPKVQVDIRATIKPASIMLQTPSAKSKVWASLAPDTQVKLEGSPTDLAFSFSGGVTALQATSAKEAYFSAGPSLVQAKGKFGTALNAGSDTFPNPSQSSQPSSDLLEQMKQSAAGTMKIKFESGALRAGMRLGGRMQTISIPEFSLGREERPATIDFRPIPNSTDKSLSIDIPFSATGSAQLGLGPRSIKKPSSLTLNSDRIDSEIEFTGNGHFFCSTAPGAEVARFDLDCSMHAAVDVGAWDFVGDSSQGSIVFGGRDGLHFSAHAADSHLRLQREGGLTRLEFYPQGDAPAVELKTTLNSGELQLKRKDQALHIDLKGTELKLGAQYIGATLGPDGFSRTIIAGDPSLVEGIDPRSETLHTATDRPAAELNVDFSKVSLYSGAQNLVEHSAGDLNLRLGFLALDGKNSFLAADYGATKKLDLKAEIRGSQTTGQVEVRSKGSLVAASDGNIKSVVGTMERHYDALTLELSGIRSSGSTSTTALPSSIGKSGILPPELSSILNGEVAELDLEKLSIDLSALDFLLDIELPGPNLIVRPQERRHPQGEAGSR